MDTEAVVRRAFDAFNLRQTEAFLELFDGDAEIVPVRAALENVIYQGRDGVRRFIEDTDASWSDRQAEVLDLEVSGEQALVIGRSRLTGRASGARTEQALAWTISVRDGCIERLTTPSAIPVSPDRLSGPSGPSASTHSMSGCAHAAKPKSPSSHGARIERTRSTFAEATCRSIAAP
jgi:ketosteroid isomerase-like protein